MIIPDAGPETMQPDRPRGDVLERLAAALGTTASVFRTDRCAPAGTASAHWVAARQGADLMEAFGRVTDPESRRRCLAYLRSVASAETTG